MCAQKEKIEKSVTKKCHTVTFLKQKCHSKNGFVMRFFEVCDTCDTFFINFNKEKIKYIKVFKSLKNFCIFVTKEKEGAEHGFLQDQRKDRKERCN